MICLRVLFLATLAVMGLDYDRAQPMRNIPVTFNYMNGSKLNIDITLQNVPPVANYYLLNYITENCDANIRTEKHNQQQGRQCYETGKKGPIPKNESIHVTQKLNRESITLYIEILNSTSNNTCSTKKIMDGVRDLYADKVASPLRACLSNYRTPCEIIVDFNDTCEANTSHKGNESQDEEGLGTLATGGSPEPPAETPQDQHSIEPSNTIYFIGIASVAGIIILISLIYMVIKKWYRKSSDPEQTLQLETYASNNAVLYAELDIRRGDAPPPPRTYDPTYAKIIGVLRPQNENDKK